MDKIYRKSYNKENRNELLSMLSEQPKDIDIDSIPPSLGFRICNFSNIKIENIFWGRSIFLMCNFDKCTFENSGFFNALILGTKFHECTFKNVTFSRNQSRVATFENCVFENCIFNNGFSNNDIIKDSIIKICQFEDIMFTSLECKDLDIENIYCRNAIFTYCNIEHNIIKNLNDASCGTYYIIQSKCEHNILNNALPLVKYEDAHQNIGKLTVLREIRDEVNDDNVKKIIENKLSDVMPVAKNYVSSSCYGCVYNDALKRKCVFFNLEARYKCWEKKEQ